MSNEKKASGISPEKQSELDSLLEDLIERENIAEEEINENQRKVDEEKIKVTEVRQQAMENWPKQKEGRKALKINRLRKGRGQDQRPLSF